MGDHRGAHLDLKKQQTSVSFIWLRSSQKELCFVFSFHYTECVLLNLTVHSIYTTTITVYTKKQNDLKLIKLVGFAHESQLTPIVVA